MGRAFSGGDIGVQSGREVWRTADGTNWTQVNPDGFGDNNNRSSYWDNGLAVLDEQLYVGNWNWASGAKVWAMSTDQVYLPIVLK